VIAAISNNIIAFLNRMGHKNANVWLKSLNVMQYQAHLVSKFRSFCDTIILAIHRYGLRFERVLPDNFVKVMERVSQGFKDLRDLGAKMIPQALKELHQKSQNLQRFIHSGGVPPPSRSKVVLAQTGKKTVTYAEEARLLETPKKRIIRAGKHPQKLASTNARRRAKIDAVYRHEPGYPDLLSKTDPNGYYPNIAAASKADRAKHLSRNISIPSTRTSPINYSHKAAEGSRQPLASLSKFGTAVGRASMDAWPTATPPCPTPEWTNASASPSYKPKWRLKQRRRPLKKSVNTKEDTHEHI